MTHVGEVAWYVTGRFYATAKTLLDVGYFLHLQGLPGPIFEGEKSENTALLTFAAEPFTAPSIANGGLEIGIDHRGTFRLYLRDTPGASFDDPASFSAGKCIAVFERVSMVPTTKITLAPTTLTLLSNVFTAKLTESTPFDWNGATYDVRDLIGFGVTQWGTAATEPLTPPASYEAVVPFVGSAIRVG
jgi:hypothetical protein